SADRHNLPSFPTRRSSDLESDRFDIFNFISESLCLVVHENHPLASKHSVHLKELKHESFIMFNEDFYLNEIITSACKNAGFMPRSEEHTSELQSRFDLVCR